MEWHWTFYGFQTPAGNRPVQEWFDSLSQEVKDELGDLFTYLQKRPAAQWGKPEFAPLGNGLFEVRHQDKDHWYRIYGIYWPNNVRQAFTLLHGTTKKVKNDADGKSMAERRRAQLEKGDGTTHRFDFSGELTKEAESKR